MGFAPMTGHRPERLPLTEPPEAALLTANVGHPYREPERSSRPLAGGSGIGIAGERGIDAFDVPRARCRPILGIRALECEALTRCLFPLGESRHTRLEHPPPFFVHAAVFDESLQGTINGIGIDRELRPPSLKVAPC